MSEESLVRVHVMILGDFSGDISGAALREEDRARHTPFDKRSAYRSYRFLHGPHVEEYPLLGLLFIRDPAALALLTVDLSLRAMRRVGLAQLVVLISGPYLGAEDAASEADEASSAPPVDQGAIYAKLAQHGFAARDCVILTAPRVGLGEPDYGTGYEGFTEAAVLELLHALDSQTPLVEAGLPSPDVGWEALDALLAALDPAVASYVPFFPSAGDLSIQQIFLRSQRPNGSVGGTFVDAHPYLERDQSWPTCGSCQKPMDSVFQIDPRDTAQADAVAGLFVVFFCCVSRQGVTHEVRYYAEPHTERRQQITLPPMGPLRSWSHRLGYELRPMGRLRRLPALRHLPKAVRSLFTATGAQLSRSAGALHELCVKLYASPFEEDQHLTRSGGSRDAPLCLVCQKTLRLLFQTDLLCGHGKVFELWVCPCTPAGATFRRRFCS